MNDFKDLLQKYKNDLIENGYEENIKTETIDIIEETKNKLRSNCNFNISIQVMTLNIYEVIK